MQIYYSYPFKNLLIIDFGQSCTYVPVICVFYLNRMKLFSLSKVISKLKEKSLQAAVFIMS